MYNAYHREREKERGGKERETSIAIVMSQLQNVYREIMRTCSINVIHDKAFL